MSKSKHPEPFCPSCGNEMHNTNPPHGPWYCPKQKASLDASGMPFRGHRSATLTIWDEKRLDAWHSPV